MTPRRVYRLPPNTTFDKVNGRYRWRNPITGEKFWLGKDRIVAEQRAKKYNRAAEAVRAQEDAHGGLPTVASVIDLYIENVAAAKPWDDSTRRNHVFALELYKREFTATLFGSLDRVRIADWIGARVTTGEAFNKHRARWIDVYRYAIARGLVDFNEAEAVMKRSTSKKIAANRKRRTRLSLEHFRRVHEQAPPWLRIAMETSIVTLQARAEVCGLQKGDLRGGWLYIIRDKTAGDTDMAFIRIRETPTIRDIWRRAWEDGVHCPYVVHRQPASLRPQHQQNKPHFAYVEPGYLTKAFRKARDAAGVGAHLEPDERPTFHEIRSLGGRLYRKMGWTREQVQALMAHGDPKTTDIYLTTPEALTDEHYRPVEATMNLQTLLEAK